jgi:translation initiation factor 6
MNILGSPNIGVYALVTNRFILVPPRTPNSQIGILERTLSVPVTRMTLGGTALLGVLAASNSNGIVVPDFVSDEEMKILSAVSENAIRLESKRTAFGNLILVNDHGAIVAHSLYKEKITIRRIQNVLGVEIVPGEIARLPYVGSLVAVTNRAALAHPLLEEEEKKLISKHLRVRVDVGTVNRGSPLVQSGILVNDNGVVVGPLTAGPELMIVTNLFGV